MESKFLEEKSHIQPTVITPRGFAHCFVFISTRYVPVGENGGFFFFFFFFFFFCLSRAAPTAYGGSQARVQSEL